MLTIQVPASGGKAHTVRLVAGGEWVCSCQDHVWRARGRRYSCKHIGRLAASLAAFATGAVHSEASKKAIGL